MALSHQKKSQVRHSRMMRRIPRLVEAHSDWPYFKRTLEPARVTVVTGASPQARITASLSQYGSCPAAHGRPPPAVRQSKNLAAKLTDVRVGGPGPAGGLQVAATDSRPRRVSPGPAATASELGAAVRSARLGHWHRSRLNRHPSMAAWNFSLNVIDLFSLVKMGRNGVSSLFFSFLRMLGG
jgi:hypothetical protein